MVKKLVKWPHGPVDKTVLKWLDDRDIKSEDVSGYRIQRESDGSCWIELLMWFDPEEDDGGHSLGH